jgi:hypothetical protein
MWLWLCGGRIAPGPRNQKGLGSPGLRKTTGLRAGQVNDFRVVTKQRFHGRSHDHIQG